jgi:AhpD family alkylhydroperoxidase
MASAHQRLDIHDVDPKAHQAVFALERYVRESGLDPGLYELVKIRASQLNGCAYCLDMHNRDARKAGIVALLMAVATINVWNRLAVSTHQRLPDPSAL